MRIWKSGSKGIYEMVRGVVCKTAVAVLRFAMSYCAYAKAEPNR